MADPLSVSLLTREYPPEVYGGAGVHVEYLARELGTLIDVSVQCFGKARSAPEVQGAFEPWSKLAGSGPHLAALRTISVDLLMAAGAEGASLVHSHTWYANFAGHLAKLLYGIPHVMTSHSLEPLRPWKSEQLAGGYQVSSFCERLAIEQADAVIAVSEGMKRDILRSYPNVDPARVAVIYNGIDTEQYRPTSGTDVLEREGIDPALPSAVFLGRITRQKGVVHLLQAAHHLDPSVQLILCAGEPDTEELGDEFERLASELKRTRGGVFWIERMLPRHEAIQVLSHATVFVCPSIYEPFGIVNLEAMACGVPVVATAVGGIPEVVLDGQTGLLVDYECDAHGTPKHPGQLAEALAASINRVVADTELRQSLGRAGRERVVECFSWPRIAAQTVELYKRLVQDR